MVDKLIINYINNLKKSDIKSFALNNSIVLSDSEIDTIYGVLKNEWRDILYGDYNIVLNKYKDKFDKDNFDKIKNLIVFYKQKYISYL